MRRNFTAAAAAAASNHGSAQAEPLPRDSDHRDCNDPAFNQPERPNLP
jgi:hypothetical protein